MFDFDEIVDRTGTQSLKLEVLPEGCPKDALPMWVADMDFKCAPAIIEALQKRLNHGIFGYTVYEDQTLKQAVRSWFLNQYEWDVPNEQIVFSPGVVPAISFLLQALTQAGDKVVIQRPVYYPFTDKIEATKRVVVNSPLKKVEIQVEGKTRLEYQMDYEDLDQKFADPDVKGIILCSPHNPVGRVWRPEELKKLVEVAKRHNKWIISDEIHMDLRRMNVTHTPLLKLCPEYADNIIVCTAPSKSFNLAGMQLSNIVIPNETYRNEFLRVEDLNGIMLPNPFGVVAATAAYTKGEPWLRELRKYLDANMQLVYDFFDKELPKAKVAVCEATYLMWFDLSAYEPDCKKLEELMQHKAKIAFDEGYIFGPEGEGFERLNVASPRSVVQDALNRIKSALVG